MNRDLEADKTPQYYRVDGMCRLIFKVVFSNTSQQRFLRISYKVLVTTKLDVSTGGFDVIQYFALQVENLKNLMQLKLDFEYFRNNNVQYIFSDVSYIMPSDDLNFKSIWFF